jgi:uncharacterized membrane-anchored protein YitT (DUF2179 family)
MRSGGWTRSLIIVIGTVLVHVLGVALFSPSAMIAPGFTAICLLLAMLLSHNRDIFLLFKRARIYVAAVALLFLVNISLLVARRQVTELFSLAMTLAAFYTFGVAFAYRIFHQIAEGKEGQKGTPPFP